MKGEISMNNIRKYKGFEAKIVCDQEDSIYQGTIINIRDSVSFHANHAYDIDDCFHSAVESYLDCCKAIGKEPEFT